MIEYLVKKRKITLLFFIMAMIVGAFSFVGLPQQEIPDIVIKYATITTIYPGASAQKIEQTVTKVVEQKVKEIQGIKEIISVSSEGYSSITIKAKDEADTKEVWDKLRKNVQDVREELPEGVKLPVVNDDLASSFIGSYAITTESKKDLYKLNDLMISWRDQLRSIPGVAKVDLNGIPKQEVHISVDSNKLQQYQINWEQVLMAVEGEKQRVPTGGITFQNRSYQLIVKDVEHVDILNNLLVTRSDSEAPVYLKDIATVEFTHAKSEYFAYYNGKPVVTIGVGAETGSDVPSMNKLVQEKLEQLKKSLPSQAQLITLFAQKDRVDEIFTSLTKETVIAIAAVLVICMLGMSLLTASLVALAIPVSIAIGLILLPSLHVTLNEMSVIGLIIVLGILVDDAVVVNDNIERRLKDLGEEPHVAAVKGTKEVAISILTATLATISAFAPLIFLKGDIGAFIKPIPIVISLTMLASMVMSLTIIPIFREWYEKRRKTTSIRSKPGILSKQIEEMGRFYSGNLMKRVIKRPFIVGFSGLLIGTAAYFLVVFVPVELFPKSERPELTINVEMPAGTSLQETDRVVSHVANWIGKQQEVDVFSFSAGGSAPLLFYDLDADPTGQFSSTSGNVMVRLKKETANLSATIQAWDTKFRQDYPGASIMVKAPSLGIAVGKPVSIRIAGEDVEQLQALSQQVKAMIVNTNGTYNVKDDMGIEQYGLELDINKQAMDQYMVSYTNLTRTLLLASDGITTSQYNTGKNLISIRLFIEKGVSDPNELFHHLNVTNAAGKQIPLSQVAVLKPAFSVQQIKHYNLARTITIDADVKGRTATDIMTEITGKLNGISFPEGFSWAIGGETSEQDKIFSELGALSVFVFFLILMLITIQFYSVSIPLIIMTTVYLAAAGGIIGIFITGMPIGFMSMMGIISLAGIVVRNGIVLIEFIEDARHAGAELEEAIIQATAARFRPILLTSLTAIVGMIPIALIGDILFRPMANTIIFGLIFSTILTLFVVPSLYLLVARYKLKRQQRRHEQQFNKKMKREDSTHLSV
ncbi:efflux RND transporter permease subunit [Paenibacillus sp. UMB4589-SE434]|uniref:efflux RND transporter permease subunit n=1 Tax=Paenibacillus sp. UMB4589-SE434 TaxID=3046314 RepID=UPI00254F3203|nr:efflux RND transporter permease subunit [Paenibacillus sp. UMB4589-SE434]MDK8180261.1 efflux RND transporter permease subunit [Paenibacillus sp. UMB4589-SE434]